MHSSRLKKLKHRRACSRNFSSIRKRGITKRKTTMNCLRPITKRNIELKVKDCCKPSDCSLRSQLLGSIKSMEPDVQLEFWKAMIENHSFNLHQLTSLHTAIGDRIRVDIISGVPYEIARHIMGFLSPRDLCQAAQVCKSWQTVSEDYRLWREICEEEGLLDDDTTLEALFKKKKRKQEQPASNKLKSKAAYLKHMNILRNWRTRNFVISEPFIAPMQEERIPAIQPLGPRRSLRNREPANLNNLQSNHLMQLRCHDDSVITCLQYNSKTNTIVSGSDDQTLKVWNSETGRCIATLEGHTGGVWSSQLSPDNIVISGSTDRTLKVWRAHTGELLHTLYGHTSTVRCLALQGDRVVSGSRDTTLRLWNIVDGSCEHVFQGHSAAVRCVEYKNDIIVSGAYDYLVMVWDAKTGACCHALEGHTGRIYSLQFDGKTIASGSLDKTICIWDVTTGKLRHRLEGHESLTSEMQLKGNLLVSANADSYCKIWDIKSGECLQTLGDNDENKHTSAITSLYINNWHVATSSDDGTVKLWDIRNGKFIKDLMVLPSKGGVVWRIKASYTKLICAVGSRVQTEDTHLVVLNFNA